MRVTIIWMRCHGSYGVGDLESYDRVDVRVARSFYIGKSGAKLELIGQNLGGDYHEFNQNNVFETRIFVRASLQFH